VIELSLRHAIDLPSLPCRKRCAEVLRSLRSPPSELGLSSSVRAHLGHDKDGVSLHILDLRSGLAARICRC